MRQQAHDILRTLALHRQAIRSLGVRRLGLFGSASRNEAAPDSDLDFIVEFDRKSFDAYMDLKLFLEDLFHRSVDLVLTDRIKPRISNAIRKEAIYAPGL